MNVGRLRDHREAIALLAILLIGLGLRLWRIDWQSGWSDEVFSLTVSQQAFRPMTEAIIRDFVNPPIYYYFLHLWMRATGTGIVEARLFSVLCGELAIFVLFCLVKRLCGFRAGLLAALLAGISQTAIAYSQEARTYSLTLLLSLCTVWLFVIALRRHRFWWGFAGCALLTIYTHYYAVFLVVGLFIFAALYRNTFPIQVRSWIGAWLLWVAAYVPWLASGIIEEFRKSTKLTEVGTIIGFHWFTLVSSLNTFNNGRWNGVTSSAPRWTFPVGALLFTVPMVVLIIGYLRNSPSTKSDLERRTAATLFGTLWLVPMLSVLGLTALTQSQYGVRYILIALAPYYGLVALAITDVKPRFVRRFLVASVLVFSAGALHAYYFIPSKTDYRGAGPI